MMFFHINFDVADGIVVFFQTERIGVSLRLGIFCGVNRLDDIISLVGILIDRVGFVIEESSEKRVL